MEFLSEVVMGKIMKGGKVVLLLSGRLVQLLAVFYCPIFGEIPLSELESILVCLCSMCDTVVVHQVCREKGSYREALRRGNQRQAFQVETYIKDLMLIFIVMVMTILNIATILMNMKSSWFSDSISRIA